MLINSLSQSENFERALRQRRRLHFGMLAVGITIILCYRFLVKDNAALPDFIRGFYLGAGTGFSLGAVGLLLRATYLLRHPEAMKRAKIRETDEREKQITQDAYRYAGVVVFFTTAAALFVVLPFSFAAFYALLGAMILYGVTFLLVYLMGRWR